MNNTWTPFRLGLKRGLLEFRHSITSTDLIGFLFPSVIALIVILFLRDVDIAGAPVSLGSMTLPSLLGMNLAFGGLAGLAGQLLADREDGTLLRAKAIPGGMNAYMMSAVVSSALFISIGVLIIMVPGLVMFEGVAFDGPGSWLTFLLVMVLGLAATLPVGALISALVNNPRNMGLIMLPMMGVIAISGIFYPITALPEWLQAIGQAFPFYWLGLGMRSALLPDSMAAVEIGESWRYLEMLGVLGLWGAIGLILAPKLLSRVARRESGSAVAARRERAMQTVR